MRWQIGQCTFERTPRRISCGRVVTRLNYRQAKLLEYLILNYGRPYTDKELIREVWEGTSAEGSIYKYINVLRDALGGERKSYIDTDPYRLIVEPETIMDDQSGMIGRVSVGSHPASNSDHAKGDRHQGSADERLDLTLPTSHIQQVVLSPRSISVMSKPDLDAERLTDKYNAGDKSVVGCVIETHAHPFLDSNLPFEHTGWAPESVLLVTKGGVFDADLPLGDPRIIEVFDAANRDHIESGKGPILKAPDGIKHTIIDASSSFHDVDTIAITLQKTNYFSIVRIRPAISRSPQLRREYGHVEHCGSRIPQATAVQFCVKFLDNRVLAILRGPDTFPWPNTWSFSGEEQLAPIDMEWDEPDRMRYALLRAALEEIFPLGRAPDKHALLEIIRRSEIETHIRSMRVWSMFLEEPTATFQFLAVFELNLTALEYAKKVREMVRSGLGSASPEGRYFSIAIADAPQLLSGEPIRATPLFGLNDVEVSPLALHPTSRYRLLRLIRMIDKEGILR